MLRKFEANTFRQSNGDTSQDARNSIDATMYTSGMQLLGTHFWHVEQDEHITLHSYDQPAGVHVDAQHQRRRWAVHHITNTCSVFVKTIWKTKMCEHFCQRQMHANTLTWKCIHAIRPNCENHDTLSSMLWLSRTAMKIHVSNTTCMALTACDPDYILQPRGEMSFKVCRPPSLISLLSSHHQYHSYN